MKRTLQILGILALGLLVMAAIAVASVWAPDRSVESLSVRWAPPPSQFIAVEGMQVHLRDEGPRDDPRPIVLIHGTSASLHTWEGWAEGLRGQRRVIRFDLPGFGLTGPHPQNDYSMAAYVKVVAGVLQKLGVQHCVLAGNSLGGQIAWEAALALPQQVDQLVLVDAGGLNFQPKSIPIGFRIAAMPGLRDLMAHILPRGVIESSLRNVYGDPSKVTPELVDRYYELTLRAGNREALGYRWQQRQAVDEAVLRGLKMPTLVLWGGKDLLIPVDNAHRFVASITGAQLVVWDDLGHVPHEEDPARTLQALRNFLN